MVNDEELSRALLDVRKAYRLLYLFQRRILDLLEELSGKLGQQFYYWLPSGDPEAQAILPSKNPCERNSWKMLPLFDASFLFLPPGVNPSDAPRKGQWLLELLICPDDGQPEKGGTGEVNPVDFPDPAGCHSMIHLYACIIQEDMQGGWWRLYSSLEWPEEDGVAEAGSAGVRLIALSGDLASLSNSAAVKDLADRFRELVNAQGGNVT
jgi:hypothetical protein